MATSITCPKCASPLKVAARAVAGKKIRCPMCHVVFTAPEADTAFAEPEVAPRAQTAAPPAFPTPDRPARAREYAEEPTDDLPKRRRRPAEERGNAGVVIGLVGGGVALLLVLGCAFVGLLWTAPRGPGAGGDGAFVPPDIRGGPGRAEVNPPAPPPAREWAPNAGGWRDDQILVVVVTGMRDGNVSNYVLDKLKRLLSGNRQASFSRTRNNVMEVALAPVGDPRAFARRIDFATVTRIDGRVVYLSAANVSVPAPAAGTTAKPPPAPGKVPAATDFPGLVAYWPFEDDNPEQVADRSGHGNDGKVTGAATRVPGVRGKALGLANEAYFEYGSNPELNFQDGGAFTIAFWVRTTADSGTVLSQRHSTDDGADLDLLVAGGRFMAHVRHNGGIFFPAIDSNVTVNDGGWHHCALTRAGKDLELYVDGNRAAAGQGMEADGPITTDLRAVGRDMRWHLTNRRDLGSDLTGAVDEVCIFNRVLTAAEIHKLAGRD